MYNRQRSASPRRTAAPGPAGRPETGRSPIPGGGPSRGSGHTGPPTQPLPAVAQACDFCRRRKIRCDGAQPCENCNKRGITCETLARDSLVRRPRPSRGILQALEQELEGLKDFVETLKEATPDKRNDLLSTWQRDSADLPSPAGASRFSGAAQDASGRDVTPSELNATHQVHVAIDGQTSYHGHTSVFHLLHDGYHGPVAVQGHAAQPAYTTSQEKQLAEDILTDAAARARNTEIMDLAAGRLDFDGIPPEIGMELLAIHWHRQHHALLLTYRPAFMRDMATGGQYFSKLLLNVIYFGASKFSRRPELRDDHDDPRTAGFKFLRRINELMGESISRSRIPTVQALLLLASSLFALGQHESSWLYSGLAFRMIIDLGLHIDNSAFDKSLTPEDVEIRRRVLYGSFCFDKIHSLYQGRPPTLQESDIKVPLVFNDSYEETELWRPTSYHTGSSTLFRSGIPAYSVTTFSAMCQLCFILGRVLNSLYSFSSFGLPPARHMENLRSIEESLNQFEKDLPTHLKLRTRNDEVKPCPSNVLALHAVWQTMIILLYRPFVELGHLRDPGGEVTEKAWQSCIKAADTMSDILRTHNETLGFRRAPFLISYCAYIAATIKGANSPAMRRLQFCMEVFQETETINTGVSRAKQVLLSLMDRLGVPQPSGSVPEDVTVNNPGPEAAYTIGGGSETTDLPTSQIDMDALFRSFATFPPDQPGDLDSSATLWPSDVWPAQGGLSGEHNSGADQDVLYGLMSGGNLSSYDGLFKSHNL